METIVNFRELANFKTTDGRKIKPGVFFRSGELVKISKDDKEALLDTYKVRHIYDFRNSQEVNERPDDKFSGADYHHIDLMKDDKGGSASLDDMVNMSSFDPNQAMYKIYEEIILSNSGKTGYQEFFEDVLSHEEEAVLFHCFAGKDRTGMAAGLLLSILNTNPQDIMDDYLKTNEARKSANDEILATLAKHGFSKSRLDSIELMLYVKPEYLKHGFQVIKKNFDTVENYFLSKDGLNLPKSSITDMKKLYTVE
ncbi:MAG: tyrosine-protein phosphatase [Lactobacillales bacterium]|jgi:protein-tyrosine phosphatase|nr:tyrosine-protein phosphatase [Lactobacillales bacterium]